jgi:hypothetical protein
MIEFPRAGAASKALGWRCKITGSWYKRVATAMAAEDP